MLDSGLGIPFGTHSTDSNHETKESTRRCIWLSQEELTPNNLEALKEVLRLEKAPLKYWLLVAFSYKSLGHLESFDSLLKDAEALFGSEEDSNYHKGSLYSSLGFHNLTQAFQFKNDDERHSRHMDWANHYSRKAEGTSQYHFYLLKGHQHLMNFTKDKNLEHLLAARSMFQMALSSNHTSIVAGVFYGNVMVLSSNYQVASVFYLRSLLLATYYLSIVDRLLLFDKDVRDPNNLNDDSSLELSLVRSQLVWLKALLFFALSACQFSLGNIESAMSLVEKSISVKPLSVSHRLASAITAYQLTHFKEGCEDVDVTKLLKEYSKSCLASYMLDKNNPVSLLHMCEFLFHRGELDECSRKLVELQKLNLPYNLRSELEYQLGRVEHVRSNYGDALSYYLQALSLKSDFMSARLQLVKVAARCGDLGLAREHCDYLLQVFPKVPVVLKLSAYVYLCSARETLETNRWDMLKLESVNKTQNQLDISCMFHTVQQGMGRLIDERLFKSLSLLEELLFSQTHRGDGDDHIEIVKLTSKSGSKGSRKRELNISDPLALEFYIRCLEILVSRGREYLCQDLKDYYCEYFNTYKNKSPHFRNNFGVILMYTRDYLRSCEVLEELNNEFFRDELEDGSGKPKLNHTGTNTSSTTTTTKNKNTVDSSEVVNKLLGLTVRFNYALSLEFSGQVVKAHKIYSSLTKDYPRYISAWLRKSIISFNKGDLETSGKYLEQVKRIHPLSCEPYLLRSYHLGRMKMFDDAIQEIRKMFRAIPSSTYDPYANTLLASLMIKKAYKISQTTGVPVVYPKEAMQYAKTALKRPSVCNFYAANCIAVLLALDKNLKASYDSFLLLLESLSVTSHMKLLVNKNMGILSAALTLSFLGTDKKLDKNKLNKLKVAKTQQLFQSAISNGKMDKNLYICYTRFLFDVQKFEECISMLETARIIFQDEIFTYNQIVATDAMVCTYLRDVERTSSVIEMNNMLAGCKFIVSSAEQFLMMNQRGFKNELFANQESCNKLKQILNRIKGKVIPHIASALPQLEKSCENKQKAREKRLQLQLTIQQAQEAKKRQMEEEKQKAREAEEELSQQLLKEASEIASELLLTKPTQT